MLKIKLQPTGKKHQISYRIVVAEDKSKITGTVLDTLGTYNPHLTENQMIVDKAKYESWLKKGAQPTGTIRKLVK